MPTTHNWITQAMTGALAIVLLSTGVAWAEGGVDARERRARQALEVLRSKRPSKTTVFLAAAGAAAVVMMVCANATGNPLCIPTGA